MGEKKCCCGRDIHNSDFCIFHAPINKKSTNDFWREFDKYLTEVSFKYSAADEQDKPYVILDCRHFVFPEIPKGRLRETILFRAVFNNAEFGGEAHFSNTTFKREVTFLKARFLGPTYFEAVNFEEDVIFEYCEFEEEVVFDSITCEGESDFSDAHFKGEVSLLSCEFKNKATFKRITFADWFHIYDIVREYERDERGEVKLDELGKNALVKNPFAEVLFIHVRPIKWGKVIIKRTKVKQWSFLGAEDLKNADRFDIVGAIWGKNRLGRIKLKDEVLALKGEFPVEEAAEVYRRLRLNFEGRLAYADARDFHIGEMIMLRKSFWGNKRIISWLFSWFYNAISRYGEGFIRPLFAILIMGFVFGIGWYYLGDPGLPATNAEGFWGALKYSYKSSFTLPTWDTRFGHFLYAVLQKSVGAGIITLFILALKRTFKR